MKKEINILKLGLICIVALIIIAGLSIFFFETEYTNYNELTEVRIKAMGTMLPDGDEYVLKLENGVWFASHNRIEWNEDNITETVVDDDFAYEIIRILKENKAHKWNDFNIKYEIMKKTKANMTDGTNYYFCMCFSNGDMIKIEEYNIYPETYMTVFEEFEKQYKQLFNND